MVRLPPESFLKLTGGSSVASRRTKKDKTDPGDGPASVSQPDEPKLGKVALRFKTKDEQICVTGIAVGNKQFTSKDGKFLVDADLAREFLARGDMERC